MSEAASGFGPEKAVDKIVCSLLEYHIRKGTLGKIFTENGKLIKISSILSICLYKEDNSDYIFEFWWNWELIHPNGRKRLSGMGRY